MNPSPSPAFAPHGEPAALPAAACAPRRRRTRGVTLIEVIVALSLLTAVMLAFLGTSVQSRRITETSVMHAAVTSFVYGLIEQMKGLDYTTLVPSTTEDPTAPTGTKPPYIRVRVNQDQLAWLQSVLTLSGTTPKAPTLTPAPEATAESLGAIDNIIGPLPLSSVSGTQSQMLTLNLWVWIDEMPNEKHDVVDVKRITVVYTYQVNDGARIRTFRDREVFIRTRFDL